MLWFNLSFLLRVCTMLNWAKSSSFTDHFCGLCNALGCDESEKQVCEEKGDGGAGGGGGGWQGGVEWKKDGMTQTPGYEAAQADKQTNGNSSVCGRCGDLGPLNCDTGLTEVLAAGQRVTANRAGWVCVSVFVWVRKWSVPLRRKADSALAVAMPCMPIIFSAPREQEDGPLVLNPAAPEVWKKNSALWIALLKGPSTFLNPRATSLGTESCKGNQFVTFFWNGTFSPFARISQGSLAGKKK